MKRCVLLSAAVAVGLFAVAGVALAGPHGGAPHGAPHGGAPHGAYHGGYYHDHFHGPGVVIGLGFYGSPFYGYPYAYPYAYPYPYAYDPPVVVAPRVIYAPPAAGDAPVQPAQPSYTPPQPQPVPPPPQPKPVTPANSASIRVLVPDPQARVTFDGNPTSQTGTDRLFHTPSLVAGANNTYRIRAAWVENGKEMVQERAVLVAPNQSSVVDFTQPVSEGVGAPPAK
jgi:uncharacterized protein (TIGR03000 family)